MQFYLAKSHFKRGFFNKLGENMKKTKKLLLTVVFLASLIYFGVVNVLEVKASRTEELRAQIETLLAQIAQLQNELSQTQGEETAWCYNFNINLKYGDESSEINALYTALEKQGFYAGETPFEFREHMASAVVRFQEKYASEILAPYGLVRGTGYVGRTTRAKLNQLYGCKTEACFSTDSDYKDVYTKGVTSYKGESKEDYCIDSNRLKEYYCEMSMGGTWIGELEYDCPFGCQDGACAVSSNDSLTIRRDNSTPAPDIIFRGDIQANALDAGSGILEVLEIKDNQRREITALSGETVSGKINVANKSSESVILEQVVIGNEMDNSFLSYFQENSCSLENGLSRVSLVDSGKEAENGYRIFNLEPNIIQSANSVTTYIISCRLDNSILVSSFIFDLTDIYGSEISSGRLVESRGWTGGQIKIVKAPLSKHITGLRSIEDHLANISNDIFRIIERIRKIISR